MTYKKAKFDSMFFIWVKIFPTKWHFVIVNTTSAIFEKIVLLSAEIKDRFSGEKGWMMNRLPSLPPKTDKNHFSKGMHIWWSKMKLGP